MYFHITQRIKLRHYSQFHSREGSTLDYRINGGGGGVRIIGGGGLEMVRFNNNRKGWNNRGGCLEK